MDKRRREEEIERDRKALEPALSGLVLGVSRPDSLSAAALSKALGEGPAPVRRPVRWVRPLAAAAAAVTICLGSLFAFWRLGFSASWRAGSGMAAPQDVSSIAMATAGEVAADMGRAADADIEEDIEESAEEVMEEGMKTEETAEMASQELEDSVLTKSAAQEPSPTALLMPSIAQTQVEDAIAGGRFAQDQDYLYYLSSAAGEADALCIVESEDFQMTAKIEMQPQQQAQAVLVSGDSLALVSDESERSEAGEISYSARADIYDVEDRSNPQLRRTIRQDGQLAASALQEGRLCLVSACPAEIDEASGGPAAPHVQDSLTEGDGTLREEALLLPEGASESCWTVFTLLSLAGEEAPASLAVFGGADSLLLSENSAYLAACGGEGESSRILSLSLGEGVPRPEGFAVLEGSLLLPQALTPLQDGLLAAVQREGELWLYRLDASLSRLQLLRP